VAARVLVFRLLGCDRGGWRYVGLPDIRKLFFANVAGSIVWAGAAVALLGPAFPRSVYGIELVLSFLATAGARMIVRSLFESRGGGAIVTMTYLGGERAVPHYNVMGVDKATLDSSVKYLAWDLGQKNVRVNAVSAGPVRTLAARSIAGFPTMEAIVEERAPLHRHVDADDVGAAAAYLLSDEARNVTGTTLYVDSGYHAMGM
jgi:enoyl-[acyl-carrier-protein] reductase (NADH)